MIAQSQRKAEEEAKQKREAAEQRARAERERQERERREAAARKEQQRNPYTPAPMIKANREKLESYEPLRPYLEDVFRNNAVRLFCLK